MTALTIEAAKAAWQEADDELAFWQAHKDEFVNQYPDQFVGVRRGAVVATSPELRGLVEKLREQNLDTREVWIHFFEVKPTTMIL